jgi:hypothetical protein
LPGCERSLNGLEIRKHDAFHPEERRIVQDLRNCTNATTLAESKGLDSDIDSDLIAELETIYDCSGWSVDMGLDPIDIVSFDPNLMNFPGKSVYPQRREIQPWSFCSAGKGYVDPMGNLGCYSMKRQRRNKTNNRGRNSGGYHGEVGISQVRQVGQAVKTAAQRNNEAFCAE